MDQEHFAPLLPYAVTGKEQGNGCCVLKVRIQVPLEMPLPARITGVVLNPELAYQEKPGDFQGFFGWLETMIYYQPYQLPAGDEEALNEEAMVPGADGGVSKEVFSGKGEEKLRWEELASQKQEDNPLFQDEFFLDLVGESEEAAAIEVVGREKPVAQEEIAALVSSGVIKEGEGNEISCLSYRVPFYLSQQYCQGKDPAVEEGRLGEGHWTAQVQHMECQLIGPRTIDLEVEIALVPSLMELPTEIESPTAAAPESDGSGEVKEAFPEAAFAEGEKEAEAEKEGGIAAQEEMFPEVTAVEEELLEEELLAEEVFPAAEEDAPLEMTLEKPVGGVVEEIAFQGEKEGAPLKEAPTRWGIGYTSVFAGRRRGEAVEAGVKRPRPLAGGQPPPEVFYSHRRPGQRQREKLCYYLVQAGDTWQKVAAAYGIAVAELLTANPDIKGDLLPGLCLRIPRR